MKEFKLDVKKIVKEEFPNASLNILVIKGLNYSDFALLTQVQNGKFMWCNINSAYSTTRVNNKELFDNEYDAIFSAVSDDLTIYTFNHIREFSKWLSERPEIIREY